ncbi:MAG: hypothetical protein JW850_20790 [Thermoflexales bacterium]|nr:hypothetical protein [Thermoflexales bacterium]
MAFSNQGAHPPHDTLDVLDEHVDEACFAIAMALRRILGVEPMDDEQDLDDEPEVPDEGEFEC